MGKPKQLKPQVLELFIANSIKVEAPKLYERLCDEGSVLSRSLPSFVAEKDSEIAVNLHVTCFEEACEFQNLSDSIRKLVDICDAENKNNLATTLRYIKADIDFGVLRFKELNEQQGSECQ